MDNLYDVLVVGAGPAGLLAARSAAEHGLKVALLEKREDPTRLVRACAQTITAANEYYFGDLPAINRRDRRFSFPGNGFSFKYDGPSQNIYAWHFVTPDNHAIQFGDRVERRKLGDRGAVGIAFDKASMTRCLLEECRALSVETFTSTKVAGIEAGPGRVTLKTDRGAFEGAYCIACDGVNSVICEQMGYNREREYFCNLHAIMTYFEGAHPEYSDIVLTTHGYIEGMAAMFYTVPRATEGDILTIVMSADPRLDMQKAQEYFFQRDWIKSWFVGAKATEHFSAVCNCYSPIVNPVRGRVVAVGDACSTQELEITGAMVSGWKAGQAVAVQIREESLGIAPQGLPRYAEWWKTTYGGTTDYETYMKSYALPYTLRSEAEINDMFAYIQGPLRACYNAYTPPLGDGLRPVRAKIMAERPDLMEKMALNRLPARQLFAEMTKISKPV